MRGDRAARLRHAEGARLRQPVLQRGRAEEAPGHASKSRSTSASIPRRRASTSATSPSSCPWRTCSARATGPSRSWAAAPPASATPRARARCARSCPWKPSRPTRRCFASRSAGCWTSASGKALMLDNAEWLAPLNYIEFLRDIGVHFSVNRMLSFETYKMRLETGLSFIEFNYQVLQSLRLPHAVPPPRLPPADGRGRPVGQHRGRHGPHPPHRGGGGLRADLAAGHPLGREEDGQVEKPAPSVPRRPDDQALRVLPVLGERPGRRT